MRVGYGLIALALLGVVSTVDAAVICKKKNGLVVIRDTACKAKEQSVNLAAFGALGPKGDTGDTGAPGDPGPLLTTLPSGRTLRGGWGFAWDAASASVAGEAPISYPFALETNPTVIVVQEGDPTPTGCTGDALDPGADSGNLCIFVAFLNGNCGAVSTYGIADGIGDFRFGAMAYAFSNGATFCEGSGTWAVTAP